MKIKSGLYGFSQSKTIFLNRRENLPHRLMLYLKILYSLLFTLKVMAPA